MLTSFFPTSVSLVSSTDHRRFQEILKARDWDAQESSLLLCDDDAILSSVQTCARDLGDQTKYVIVVGIGGSNLGTKAIYDALEPWEDSHTTLLFADTVDPSSIQGMLKQVEHSIKSVEELAIFFVSKSGTTTEVAANFSVLIQEITKRYGEIPSKRIVAITDQDSKLEKIAIAKEWGRVHIPKTVGGRYSVLSAVGLLPLLMTGVDIASLRLGAKEMRDQNLAEDGLAFQLANFLFQQIQEGKSVYDLFVFEPRLETLGKWFRQLLAESLGKDGKGILPTVSIGTNDLHSVVQYYLGGPKQLVTTFVSVAPTKDYAVGQDVEDVVPGIGGKTLAEIKKMILTSVKKSYSKAQIPYMDLYLEKMDAYHLGAFLQLYMMSTMILGSLLKVNAFDQPNVEDYKSEMRTLLDA